jgi:hypothetical protein
MWITDKVGEMKFPVCMKNLQKPLITLGRMCNFAPRNRIY